MQDQVQNHLEICARSSRVLVNKTRRTCPIEKTFLTLPFFLFKRYERAKFLTSRYLYPVVVPSTPCMLSRFSETAGRGGNAPFGGS
jgi:hypothetical protein